MCGITGFFEPSPDEPAASLEALVTRMATTLRHRGPDDGGAWVDAEIGIAFGHRRLAVVDLSEEGHQPMHSASGRLVICYNGEVYNHRELRREVEGKGYKLRGQSDTEVILAAIEEWGLGPAVERFNGMFAFALWDRPARQLHLVRDRLGEKPLYYGRLGRTLVFASELKALRVHPSFRGNIDRDALALYLRHNYVPEPWCIYQGLRKLPPGTMITFGADTAGLPDPVVYWSAAAIAERGSRNPLGGSAIELTDRLEGLLAEAVKLRMEADVPLGAFLSGGVDSSTVVALMQAQSSSPVRTFSIGFEDPSYNEADCAKEVARHLGTEHTELYVTPAEAMAVIPRLPALYDEPFSDVSQIPTHLVSELARRHVTVSLSGDGGDELFAGYTRHLLGEDVWRWFEWMPRPMKRLLGQLLVRSPAAWTALLRAGSPWLPAKLRFRNPADKARRLGEMLRSGDPYALYLSLVSHWEDPAELVPGSTLPRYQLNDPSGWPTLGSFIEWMMYQDTVTYLPGDILAKVDRASMGVSLEARVPLLDHRVAELAWQLPMRFKKRGNESKWLLRQVLYRHVPRELIERPKMGFGVPIGVWLRGPLRDWAEALLSSERLTRDGLLQPAPVRRKWEEHLAGTHDWQYRLWVILMLQAWLETG